jgi:fluoride ion exporter CrcB/FEX
MHEFPSWILNEKVQVIISGALGGLVRWLTLRERFPAGVVSVVVGSICSVYLGPLVQPILNPFVQVVLTEQVSRSSFTGFLVGIGGITFSGFVIDVIRARRKEVLEQDKGPKAS